MLDLQGGGARAPVFGVGGMWLHPDEMIVDNFAGGGGASEGIEQALDELFQAGFLPAPRDVDIAINHDEPAVAMHLVNHPRTIHICQNIWQVDPAELRRKYGNRPLGLGWFSPDCTHHSKANGGQPVESGRRDLAHVVEVWGKRWPPRIIFLENVEEFRDWGPLIRRADGKMIPDPKRKGETFAQWCGSLRKLGYKLQFRELRACDYGTPTIRKRLYLIARNDNLPIVWPKKTHGRPGSADVVAGKLLPWPVAADIIDFTLPCPSIFETSAEIKAKWGIRAIRPLKPNTMARIAKGVQRYVIDAAEPFIIPITHSGDTRSHSTGEPVRTITTAKRGEHALVTPVPPGNEASLVGVFLDRQYGRSAPDGAGESVATDSGTGKTAVVAAFLAQHNTGMVGHDVRESVSTVCSKVGHQALVQVSAGQINLKGSDRRGGPITGSVPTLCAEGNHVGEVRAFLMKYFGAAEHGQSVTDPLHTDTPKPRFGLVMIHGEPHEIVDIGMRMLTVRERFRANGFPDDYVIDVEVNGKPITAEQQGRCCGNAVCPPMAKALVLANLGQVPVERAAEVAA